MINLQENPVLTIYGVYRSRATRPLWVLGEIGMGFSHIPVIQSYRLTAPAALDAPLNTMSPEFLAISPQSAIPVMVDDGLVLTESLAIAGYIARQYGGNLGPRDAVEQALCEQWALFGGISLDLPGIDILYTYVDGLQDTPEGAAKIATAAEKLARPLARLETLLSGQQHLMGGRFTVADIMVAECLRYTQPHKALMAAHPATIAWLLRCQSRPAFQAMMAKRDAET
jgi:glutathione S-transferase